MIIAKQKYVYNRKVNGVETSMYIKEIYGLSTDTKPTMAEGVEESSTFFEEDTSKAFIMQASGSWKEM